MRSIALVMVASAAVASSGCARVGNLGSGLGATLTRDVQQLHVRGGAASPGSYAVEATGLWPAGAGFPVVLYRPRSRAGRAPAVAFLPGRFATEDQYESYGRLLASHGFVVAVRGQYGPEYPDDALVRDARWLARWLGAQPYVDAARIGVAGHSMGGRDAITAAAQDARVRAVVAIDPGGPTSYPVIYGDLGRLRVPLLLIGAEVGWRGDAVCSPRATNYEHYFAQSRPGTLELVLRDADHVQVMDEPDRLGQQLCRVGTADSTRVRSAARAATVQFFAESLAGAPRRAYATDGAVAVLRERVAPSRRRVARVDPAAAIGVAAPGTSRSDAAAPAVAALTAGSAASGTPRPEAPGRTASPK